MVWGVCYGVLGVGCVPGVRGARGGVGCMCAWGRHVCGGVRCLSVCAVSGICGAAWRVYVRVSVFIVPK